MSQSKYTNTQFANWRNHTEVDFASLPPFLRVLLTTDGTVTKSLEAYFWEAVEVTTLAQSYVLLPADEPMLGLNAGELVLNRQVRLQGSETGRVYVFAESLVRTELLPAEVRAGLEKGEVGIGELLRECGLETYRQIRDFGHCEVLGQLCVWRSYLIAMAGEPFIQIRERFPVALFA